MDSQVEKSSPTAILLAAGYGSRIADLTEKPKCLLEIRGKSLLAHHLESWIRQGIKKAHFVLGFKSEEVEQEAEKYGDQISLSYSYNTDFKNKGNTYSLLFGLENISHSTSTLIFDADLMYEDAILSDFLNDQEKNQVLVGTGDINDIECAKTLTDKDGFVRKTVDKRALTEEELRNYTFEGEAIGILKFDGEGTHFLYEQANHFLQDPSNILLNWEHLLNSCLKKICVSPHKTQSHKWIEIDTAEDFERANRIFGRNQ